MVRNIHNINWAKTVRIVPHRVCTFIFSISSIVKLKSLLSIDGHFLMGAGRLYPGWLLPLALVHEVAIVVLLQTDCPLAVCAASAFIGGISHAQASPGGPMSRVGPKALVPLVVVACATIGLTAHAGDTAGPLSKRLGVARLQPLGLLLLGTVCGAAGAAFGIVAAASSAAS